MKVRTTSNGRFPMTITTQDRAFGGIDVLDDQRPGTLDVKWAEDALRHRQPINPTSADARPPHRPPRQALRRLLAGLVIAAFLVVAIVIAPGSTASAPQTPTSPAATATSRRATVPSPPSRNFGLSSLFVCPPTQPIKLKVFDQIALSSAPCLGAPLNAEQGSNPRSRKG
jgi:hypothetical protein